MDKKRKEKNLVIFYWQDGYGAFSVSKPIQKSLLIILNFRKASSTEKF